MAQEQSVGIIDPPGPFSTREMWERHLSELRKLPQNTLLRREMIATAEREIARKRRGAPPVRGN